MHTFYQHQLAEREEEQRAQAEAQLQHRVQAQQERADEMQRRLESVQKEREKLSERHQQQLQQLQQQMDILRAQHTSALHELEQRHRQEVEAQVQATQRAQRQTAARESAGEAAALDQLRQEVSTARAEKQASVEQVKKVSAMRHGVCTVRWHACSRCCVRVRDRSAASRAARERPAAIGPGGVAGRV